MKVYVVTAGEYSDYHIEAVYSTREKAELYVATHEGEIEEYDIDEPVMEGKAYYGVYAKFFADIDGKGKCDINKAWLCYTNPVYDTKEIKPYIESYVGERCSTPGRYWNVYVPTSKSKMAADERIKVVSDFWAKYKAEISEDKDDSYKISRMG